MKKSAFLLGLALIASFGLSAVAAGQAKVCHPVGGVLMTNINAIDNQGIQYNLGPVFGDLAGAVAANIVTPGIGPAGTFTLQHYWITSTGDTIKFKPAILHPTFPTSDNTIVAVPWGNYISDIDEHGSTGKYENATGSLSYFGLADFNKLTLVLRYQGEVCLPVTSTNPSKK